MCRWVFYTGPEIALADLITRPEHSLIHQSFSAALREEPLNGDGFGVAWYPTHDPAPAAFRSIQPAWNDLNLRDLARVTRSSTILAHVRAATPGLGVSQYNCHPFVAGTLSFMHNGVLGDFLRIKRSIQSSLSDAQFHRLRGTTDSEHVFALLLDELGSPSEAPSVDELGAAMVRVIGRLEALQRELEVEEPNTFNFCVSSGTETAVTRYSRGRPAESLFVHDGDASVRVASEPLGDDETWREIPPQSLVLIRADRSVETRALDVC